MQKTVQSLSPKEKEVERKATLPEPTAEQKEKLWFHNRELPIAEVFSFCNSTKDLAHFDKTDGDCISYGCMEWGTAKLCEFYVRPWTGQGPGCSRRTEGRQQRKLIWGSIALWLKRQHRFSRRRIRWRKDNSAGPKQFAAIPNTPDERGAWWRAAKQPRTRWPRPSDPGLRGELLNRLAAYTLFPRFDRWEARQSESGGCTTTGNKFYGQRINWSEHGERVASRRTFECRSWLRHRL